MAATLLRDTLFWTAFQALSPSRTHTVIAMKSFHHKSSILKNSFLSFHELFPFVRNRYSAPALDTRPSGSTASHLLCLIKTPWRGGQASICRYALMWCSDNNGCMSICLRVRKMSSRGGHAIGACFRSFTRQLWARHCRISKQCYSKNPHWSGYSCSYYLSTRRPVGSYWTARAKIDWLDEICASHAEHCVATVYGFCASLN